MFCPNCGAQNQDTANACQKCGFTLKVAAAPKFKGTMIMMNPTADPLAGVPGAQPPGQPAAPRPTPAPGPSSKLKGTMIGVAPQAGVAPNFGAPAGQAPAPQQVQAPTPQAFAAGPQAPAGHPQAPAQPAAPGPHDVNPLGGTMVADDPALYATAVSAAAGAAQPPQAAFGRQQPPQYGAPPQFGGQPGAPDQGQFGAPPQQYGGSPGPGMPDQGQFGAPPQQYGGPPGQAPYPAGVPGAPPGMVPYGQPGVTPGPGGKVFEEKSPLTVFLLAMVTCGIYGLFWLAGTKDQMEAKGAEIGPTWHIIIPILGILWLWKWCQGVEKVSNGQLSAGSSFVKIWLLGGIGMALLQSDFNDI